MIIAIFILKKGRKDIPILKDKPRIGILCWERGRVPQGLLQLETLVGDSTNPDSYSFPIVLRRVHGANIHTILENPDRKVLATMIADAKKMVTEEQVEAITTSCGFNAIFQRELSDALDVPVFTSSLLQVPLVKQIVGEKREVAIITASRAALSPAHLEAAGIGSNDGLYLFGLEDCPEWRKMHVCPEADIDLNIIRREVVGLSIDAKRLYPRIGAYVLECTDLPPFSEEIREKTGLPVFDIITLAHAIYSTL